eukprot:15504-Prorocentrum_minimum.AAC.2
MEVVHETFGAEGDLLAFKVFNSPLTSPRAFDDGNISLDTEGGQGNATSDILKNLGEIRVEIFDVKSENSWQAAYNPPAPKFKGASVTVKEGKSTGRLRGV